MTDWDPSAVAAVLRTENWFPGGSVVGVLAVGHSQTRIWVLEAERAETAGDDPGEESAGAVAGNPVILAERRLDDVGTDLFDRLLLARAAERIADLPGADDALIERLNHPKGEPWTGLRAHLVGEVRRAREELTAWHSATVEVDDIPGITSDGPLRLDRIELDNALRPHVLRLAREFAATIEESGRRPVLLDGIYLLGDGQIPLIVRSVYDVLGVSPTPVGREHLVAAGARARAAAPTREKPHNGSSRPGGVPGQGRALTASQERNLRLSPPRTKGANGVAVASGGPDGSLPPAPETEPPNGTELTDTGSLRLLRDDEDGFDEGGLDGSRQPDPRRRARRRRRLVSLLSGLTVVVALSVAGVLLVRGGVVPGLSTADPVDSELTSQQDVQATTVGTTDAGLPAVDDLTAERVGGIAIAVSWTAVEGAQRYALYRDAGTVDEKVRTTITTELTDRPGDGKIHEYTVVAIDADGTEGAATDPVEARAAAPYGKLQSIASDWSGIVPVRPGRKGNAGQTCEAVPAKTAKQVDRIVCEYPKNLTVTVSDYGSQSDVDDRYEQLAAGKHVSSDTWKVKVDGEVKDSGRMLTGGSKSSPWQWWDYDSASGYVIEADWPKHKAAKLAAWVERRLPFHQ